MKEKLISIATDTVQRAGVHAITMRDPGSSAGIKSSSVMYHFGNKNGLLQEISSSYLQLFFKRLEKINQPLRARTSDCNHWLIYMKRRSTQKRCACAA